MAVQLSVAVRNAMLDELEATIGQNAVLKIRTGGAPATCATADSGTVLATISLDYNWMNDAGSGSKTKNGTWEDASSDNSGTALHFRLYASDGTTCHMQGTVGVGSGDLQVDNTTFAAGQTFTITSFTLTAGNA